MTFDLPDSAQGWEGGGSNFLGRPPFADAPGAMLSIHQVDRVMVDPCDPEAGMHAAGQSVDELVEALVAIPVATVTGPINVDLGSITGKWLALELDEELRDCELVIYHIARPSILRAIGDGQYVEIWVLDVARERVVIESSEWPQTSDEDKAVLRALTDSLRVEAAR